KRASMFNPYRRSGTPFLVADAHEGPRRAASIPLGNELSNSARNSPICRLTFSDLLSKFFSNAIARFDPIGAAIGSLAAARQMVSHQNIYLGFTTLQCLTRSRRPPIDEGQDACSKSGETSQLGFPYLCCEIVIARVRVAEGITHPQMANFAEVY